jgi:hypothetical protein
MPVVRLICAFLTAAVLAGCATAYDPEGSNRLSVETRAAEAGTARTPPPREGFRLFRRTSVVPARNVPPPDAGNRFEPVRDAIPIPDTPAGRQLYWLMGQFNGGNSRQIDLHFSKSFQARTKVSQIRSGIIQWRRDEFNDSPADVFKLDSAADRFISVIVRGRTTDRYSRIQLGVDSAGIINFLTLTALPDFKPGELSEWTKLDSKLGGMSGHASLGVYEITDSGLKPVHTYEAGRIMSIGAISSLYIAGALAEEVKAGRASWDEKLAIRDEFKSLMGGRLQLEPPDTEFPLSKYLISMLDEGDTTAFDHLLLRTGRDNVESYMSRFCSDPSRNKPFFATMEYFRVKLGSDRTLPKKYASADEAHRRQLLSPGAEADKSVPSLEAAAHWRLPYELEHIGWFASAEDCCRLMADVYAKSAAPGMEALALAESKMNYGLTFDETKWRFGAFKSGSEPGLISMVWLVQRADGKWFTLSLIANDPKQPVDQSTLNTYAAAAFKLLGQEGKKK